MNGDTFKAHDSATVGAAVANDDRAYYRTVWVCEKWSQEAVDFTARKLERLGVEYVECGTELKRTGQKTWDNALQREVEKLVAVPRVLRVRDGVTSADLRRYAGEAEEVEEIHGNLLVNEGLQRLIDLLIAAGGVAYNNANAFTGVGDSSTAEAASQTELQAAANRFYKAMNATFPSRASQTVTFASDFTTTEANYVWAEWTIAAGATTASGAGFTSGTTNLNRKVATLGTKASGTWTLTTQITFS